MNGMQQEIDTLKSNLLEIKSELDEGKLLNEINEFSKEVSITFIHHRGVLSDSQFFARDKK
jgi:hypothetical protein